MQNKEKDELIKDQNIPISISMNVKKIEDEESESVDDVLDAIIKDFKESSIPMKILKILSPIVLTVGAIILKRK